MRNIVKINGYRQSGRTTYFIKRVRDRLATLKPIVVIASKDVLHELLNLPLPENSLMYFISTSEPLDKYMTIIKYDNRILETVTKTKMFEELGKSQVDILTDNILLPRNKEVTIGLKDLNFGYFAFTNLSHLDNKGEEFILDFIKDKEDKAYWRTMYFIKNNKKVSRSKTVWEL